LHRGLIGRKSFPAHLEEFFQQSGGFCGTDARSDFALVIEAGQSEDVDEAAGATSFGVGATEDNATKPGMNNGTRAHGAGFFGDVEVATGEAPITDSMLSHGDGKHFGMGSGIFEHFDLVPGFGDDPAVADDDGADRDFAFGEGFAGQFEGFIHEGKVVWIWDDHYFPVIFRLAGGDEGRVVWVGEASQEAMGEK